jgi:hypothetical protein
MHGFLALLSKAKDYTANDQYKGRKAELQKTAEHRKGQ